MQLSMRGPSNLWWIVCLVGIGLVSRAWGQGEQGVTSRPIRVTQAGHWRTWNFDQTPTGQLPTEFSAQTGRRGTLPRWAVRADPTAPSSPNVLVQRSKKNFGERFNLAVVDGSDYQNLELEVKLKAVGGAEDQGGGLIWRYQDPDHYYIARVNPLEQNFRVYSVVEGRRRLFKSADVMAASGTWHTMRIVVQGDRMKCFYDGKKYLEIRSTTFGRGKIGLWTKADAVTYFDDLRVRSLP